MRQLVHWINVLLLVGLAGWSISVYDELPGRVPLHFGGDGQPDRFADRGFWSWFGIVLVASAVAALLYGAAWMTGWFVRRKPRWVNVPDAERFRTLPAADRVWVMEPVSTFLYWTVTWILLVFWAVQLGVHQVATGASEELPGYVLAFVLVVTCGSLLATPVLLHVLQKRIDAVAVPGDGANA